MEKSDTHIIPLFYKIIKLCTIIKDSDEMIGQCELI